MVGGHGEDDDPVERAEHARAIADFERTRDVKPSKLVAGAAAQLSMLPICFAGVRPTSIVWRGQEIELYVQINRDGAPMSAPPPVTWSSSNPAVLSVRDGAQETVSFARVVGIHPGEAIIVATSADGIRQELALRVADEPETEWF